MPKKKLKEKAKAKAPLHRCYNCIHWHMYRDGSNNDGAVDFSSGSCDHNGYSKCPPMFGCGSWMLGSGEIADTLSLLMSN